MTERTIAIFTGRTPHGRAFNGEAIIQQRFETFDVIVRDLGSNAELRFGFAYPNAERAMLVARNIVKALAKPVGGERIIEWA